jgi:hypothetical protein
VSGIEVGVIAKRFKKLHELEPIAKSAAAGLGLGRSTGCRQVSCGAGGSAPKRHPELANFDAVNRG